MLLDEPGLRVRATFLDHRTPSLAFALEERCHVNIRKNRLAERGLSLGPWLQGLKRAVQEERAPEFEIMGPEGQRLTLRELLPCVQITPGSKYAYVTDAVFHERNVERIRALAHEADVLFIEAVFSQAMAQRTLEKCHLTAAQAGWIAHLARGRWCLSTTRPSTATGSRNSPMSSRPTSGWAAAGVSHGFVWIEIANQAGGCPSLRKTVLMAPACASVIVRLCGSYGAARC